MKGFLSLGEDLEPSDLQRYEFQDFLNTLRGSIGYLKDRETYITLAKFMDLYCVNYPELWVKFEEKLLFKKNSLTSDDKILLLTHFSNQGEGSEYFYDQFEKLILEDLHNLNAPQLTVL